MPHQWPYGSTDVFAHAVADERARAARSAALRSRPSLGPRSYVRRRREDEPPPPPRPEGAGGLRVRAEIADALGASLSRITTEPSRVDAFDDCEGLCDFGRCCFAQLCVEAGVLVVCGASGSLE